MSTGAMEAIHGHAYGVETRVRDAPDPAGDACSGVGKGLRHQVEAFLRAFCAARTARTVSAVNELKFCAHCSVVLRSPGALCI